MKLTLPNNRNLVPKTAQYVSELFSLSEKKHNDVYYVVHSMLVGRMRQLEENQSLLLEVEGDSEDFKVSVTDKGIPYILSDRQREMVKTGIVDSFSLEQLGGDGQRITFSFKRDDVEKNVPFALDMVETELFDEDYTFSELGDSDEEIIEAIKCLHSNYGFDYGYKELYNIGKFREKMHKGDIIPMVLRNAHGQYVSFIILRRFSMLDGVYEGGSMVTKPFARGRGLASIMMSRTQAYAREKGVPCAIGLPTMEHPISQRMANKHGDIPCAILWDYVVTGDGRCIDVACGVQVNVKDRTHKLYISNEAISVVKKITDGVGLDCEFVTDVDCMIPDGTTTELEYRLEAHFGLLSIRIKRCGYDIISSIRAITDAVGLDQLEKIYIYMKANDRGSIYAYEALRNNGYYFCGMIPGTADGDYLLMERFREKPDPSEPVAEPGYRELLDELVSINNL